MFKSCCARPTKKLPKSKSKPENLNNMTEIPVEQKKEKKEIGKHDVRKSDDNDFSPLKDSILIETDTTDNAKINQNEAINNIIIQEHIEKPEGSSSDSVEENASDLALTKTKFSNKRYSIDYKRNKIDFKRFSVDCHRDSATLEELARLEHELARTNVDVRPGVRRKSTGILKCTTSYNNGLSEQQSTSSKQDIASDDDEVFEASAVTLNAEPEGPREPPATPVGRDELALRRHRFFSDLVCAARAAVEHRVRFDPLGPVVADPGKILN